MFPLATVSRDHLQYRNSVLHIWEIISFIWLHYGSFVIWDSIFHNKLPIVRFLFFYCLIFLVYTFQKYICGEVNRAERTERTCLSGIYKRSSYRKQTWWLKDSHSCRTMCWVKDELLLKSFVQHCCTNILQLWEGKSKENKWLSSEGMNVLMFISCHWPHGRAVFSHVISLQIEDKMGSNYSDAKGRVWMVKTVNVSLLFSVVYVSPKLISILGTTEI